MSSGNRFLLSSLASSLLIAAAVLPWGANASWLDFDTQLYGSGLVYPWPCDLNFFCNLLVPECFRSGLHSVVIKGTPISTYSNVRNPDACQVLCTESANCAYFNFHTDGTCKIFDAFAMTAGRDMANPDAEKITFGPRVCGEYEYAKG